ncbi:MAG: ribonuclease HI [Candidatus Paceibacterota bacterium]|jgi:ribonuclease HI
MKYIIFTDGSSRGNPGRGGWAVVIIEDDSMVIELGGREDKATNNRMELTAAIEALSQTSRDADITLYTDSSYLIGGITKWVKGWKKNDWKRDIWQKDIKKDVLNRDLWEKLDELNMVRNVKWNYIRGHTGNHGNERCDEIATAFADGEKISLFEGKMEVWQKK